MRLVFERVKSINFFKKGRDECLRNLQHTAIDIRLNRAVEPRAHIHLRVRRLRAEIPRRVAERLTDRVDTDEGASIQEVLARNITRALRVDLRPLGVRVVRQQLLRR
jgi:hypothetical protein